MTEDLTGGLDLLGDWLDAKGYGEEAGLCTRVMDHMHKQDARIAALEALIIDVHEDLCCQTNYDDKIGFDKLDAEVTKIKSRVAMDGKDD